MYVLGLEGRGLGLGLDYITGLNPPLPRSQIVTLSWTPLKVRHKFETVGAGALISVSKP